MSKIQFGLPLETPSKQTVLPAITSKGMLMGFYPIANTTFDGTEETFALSDYTVPITTVTLPPRVQDGVGSGHGSRVAQYMAAQWPEKIEGQQPWIGSASWISPNNTGYFSWWSLPTEAIMKHFGRGLLINSLLVRMDVSTTTTPGAPTPPDASDGALKWIVSLDEVSLDTNCPFFDFNWPALFQTSFVSDDTQQGDAVLPLRIDTVSNPPDSTFKAVIVQTLGGQQAVAGGGVIYNTIRVMKLADRVAAGDYIFTFSISYVKDGVQLATPVTLTLTVV